MRQTSKSRDMQALQVRCLTFAAVFLAVALVLPFITGQIPEIGNLLCPMHLPVLLCGFICGWPWGLAVGFIAPLLRSVTFGMPPMYPTAVAMAFELATYGSIAGLMHMLLPAKPLYTYVSLLVAMCVGRLVWAAAMVVITGLAGSAFTWVAFVTQAITKAVPGIILQIVLIPILVIALERAGLSLNPRTCENK